MANRDNGMHCRGPPPPPTMEADSKGALPSIKVYKSACDRCGRARAKHYGRGRSRLAGGYGRATDFEATAVPRGCRCVGGRPGGGLGVSQYGRFR